MNQFTMKLTNFNVLLNLNLLLTRCQFSQKYNFTRDLIFYDIIKIQSLTNLSTKMINEIDFEKYRKHYEAEEHWRLRKVG